jgi:hypothetical protein
MAENPNPASPAGNAGDQLRLEEALAQITKAAVDAATAAVTEVLKPVATQVQQLADSQKSLTERVEAIKPGEGVNAEAVAKIVGEQLAQREAASQASADKSAARQATIEKLVKEKLGGNADLGKLLTGETDEQLAEQADAIAAEAKKLKPDFGGAASAGKDGGTPPLGAQQAPSTSLSGMSEGTQKYADSIKLPGEQSGDRAAASTQQAAAAADAAAAATDKK